MTKYNQTFKQQVVNFYFEHHENLSLTLRYFNLSDRTVSRWIAQYKYSGAHGLSRSPSGAFVQKMLLQAVKKLPKNANPILHSDQGIHYQMHSYQRLLAKNGIRQSMSRKGNCLDNAAMESFFGRMKTECFYGKTFESIDELAQSINDYVRYYNEECIQLKLKGLSPIQYRNQSFE